MRFPAVSALFVGLFGMACSSSPAVKQCAPNTAITASGTLQLSRGGPTAEVLTTYSLTATEGEDLFNAGSLTVVAGDAQGGPGTLGAHDPVVLVKMDPATDTPGTYDLASVSAKIAYCPTLDAKLVVVNGALADCAPSGKPVIQALAGSLTVTSSTDKSLGVAIPPGHHNVTFEAKYGAQTQQCN